MNIIFTAAECAPFAKTGGLGDVAAALPKALKKLGHNVKVVIPRYYKIDKNSLEHIPGELIVPMGSLGTLKAGVFKSKIPNSDVEIYFIDYEDFFGRNGLYTDESGYSYQDNDIRFAFLSVATFELCKMLGFNPDIFHANDWHTAAVPVLLKTRYKEFNAKSVLTIHNLQHQGLFDKRVMDILQIPWNHFNPYELEALGGVNLLKGGITFADAVTTVSKKYALEIQTPEFGFGLEGHIRAHSYKLYGILNGVDYDEWNPACDKYIAKNYDIGWMEGKKECKKELLEKFGLCGEEKALIGFVGRFAWQKGIELIAGAMEGLLHLDANYVFLGTGEKWAEGFFSDVSSRYSSFRVYVGFSNELAHKIEAGADMFLMPSIFEPCGLNQIYSLRYGTPPIVRATGGLDDTVENYDPFSKKGTGFKFWEASRDALYNTVKWAVDVFYNDKEGFKNIVNEGMRKRFSWERAAKEYLKVYERVLND